MPTKRLSLFLLALAVFAPSLAPFLALAQNQAETDLTAKLAAIERTVEERRKSMGVPGASLVVVKDDRVILMKGFGLRDVERNLPVTEDTLFAIGSCTKAFTAMAAEMSVDDGKLSLDDPPKKYLPYFKLQDPEADSKITVRDLLHHSSGLAGTDIPWYTGVLNREEVIRTVASAKPTAKLREKFQYQNVMYSAAGEVVARAEKSTWEREIEDRFFKPLGMKASNNSVKETLKAADHATGYDIASKTPKKLAMRDLTNIAPAGAINSNARDMAAWLRLMLGQGVFEGKRLVSERGFNELTSKHIEMGGGASYGLGWVLLQQRGQKIITHSGGIDGFNSLVALLPDKKIGLCVLTNVSGSLLPGAIQNIVFSTLLGETEPAASAPDASTQKVEPKDEAGKYKIVEAGIDIEVIFKDGKLIARVPGQPDYPLVNVSGRRYKLSDPAPDGFYITFRPTKGKESETEAYLEQPQGNLVLPKVKADQAAADSAAAANQDGPMKELIGSYDLRGVTVEITPRDGKVSLVVPGQPPYPLAEKEKDTFALGPLPDTYRMTVKRDPAGKVTGIVINQPEGKFEAARKEAGPKVAISLDELMAKMIAAAGGEENLRKRKSVLVTGTLTLENQGLTGELEQFSKEPNLFSSTTTLMALGKKIGTIREFFDGTGGGTDLSFGPPSTYSDKQIDDVRVRADFHPELNWKTLFKTVEIKAISKVGDEEVYVVVKTPEKGNAITDFVSTKTFLLLKQEALSSPPGQEASVPSSSTFGDYRRIDGSMIPFQITSETPGMGTVVTRIKEVKFNADVPDSRFKAQKK
jgi:CubicO group peptidase (beta-lactamase class C family)